jgi:hypothetical protein
MRDLPRSDGNVPVWMAAAFVTALGLTILVIGYFGAGEKGTIIALRITARLSFLLFWLAYSAGSLAALFGPPFDILKRRSRKFGLAFASAHLVHLGLVAWICQIGAAPPLAIFVFFGIAVFWTYALAIFSIPRLREAIADVVWRLLSFVGLNYILLAFARDFIAPKFQLDTEYLVGYGPFIMLCIVAPSLRFIALTCGIVGQFRSGGRVRAGADQTNPLPHVDGI